MKLVGWGLLILFLPIAIASLMFNIIIPIVSKRLKTIKKESREKLENEQKNIFDEISKKDKNISDEEKQAHCKGIGDIIEEGRKKARCAIDDEFGFDDMKSGNKEIMDELKTRDISDIFKFKNIFK